MRIKLAALFVALSGLLAFAVQNPYAGTWILNTEKSFGPVPSNVQDGILRIPEEVSTVAKPAAHQPMRTHSAQGNPVVKFTLSMDGRTLTLTQPQLNGAYRAVFEKQP